MIGGAMRLNECFCACIVVRVCVRVCLTRKTERGEGDDDEELDSGFNAKTDFFAITSTVAVSSICVIHPVDRRLWRWRWLLPQWQQQQQQ